MSLFSRLRSALGPATVPAAPDLRAETLSGGLTQGSNIWTAFTGATSAPSETQLMSVTAVSACVAIIAGSIAAMPMHIYRRAKDGDLTRDHENDLWWVLNEQPHPRWPASAAWEFLTASKLLRGDAFAEILRDFAGKVTGLLPLHPDRVRVICVPDGSKLIYEIQPDPTIAQRDTAASRVRVIDQEDILHVPGFGFNGLRGQSAFRYSLRNAGGIAVKAQTFSESFLQNLGRPDFALKAKAEITDAQYAAMREMLNEYRGPNNAGQTMILEGGLELQTITMPLEEMQLLETRKFQVEEIARAFGVPPFMIGQTEKTSSWGTGVEAMGAGFVRYTLRTHLNAFQNEINRKFWPRNARFVAEFDTMELERGDFQSMVSGIRMALGRAGEDQILSVEEGRQILRFPRKISGTVRPADGGAPAPGAGETP